MRPSARDTEAQAGRENYNRDIRRLRAAARSVCGLAAENYRQRIAASCSSTRSALEAPRAQMRGAAAVRVHGLEAARTPRVARSSQHVRPKGVTTAGVHVTDPSLPLQNARASPLLERLRACAASKPPNTCELLLSGFCKLAVTKGGFNFAPRQPQIQVFTEFDWCAEL